MPKRYLLPLCLLLAAAAPAGDAIIGTWLKDGVPFAELRADGRGRVDHDAVSWKADGRVLRLTYASGETETMPYAIRKGVLTVEMDGGTETYTRAAAKPAANAGKAPAEKAGKDQLSALLLSSPWCHFRYNKISGSSHQERVVFRRDGTWGSGARGESYSSGPAGTVSGQSDSSSGGRWQAKGATLLMSTGGGPLEDTGLSISRNSNGYPILKTGNKEYASCD